MNYIKKFLLFSVLASLCLNAQATLIPQWVSNYCSQFITTKTVKYVGIGALTLAGAGLAGYYFYKNYFSKKSAANPLENFFTNPGNNYFENPVTIHQDHQDFEDKHNSQITDTQADNVSDAVSSNVPSINILDDNTDEEDDNDNQWREKELEQPTPQLYKPIIEESIFAYQTFAAWKKACDAKLPIPFQNENTNEKEKEPVAVLTNQELDNALTKYFEMLDNDHIYFQNDHYWVDKNIPYDLFNSLQDGAVPVFDPYVQKIILPAGSTIAFHGDIHGDVHSLNGFIEKLQEEYLNGFTIIDPKFYMVFLGDYTDRGLYGAEVIYTILRLKCANPQQVFLVRGNHEDVLLNKQYTFCKELEQKFRDHASLLEKIQKMYETLPLALYLGCGNKQHKDFILCCHGGVELGFDPHALLQHPTNIAFTKLGTLDRWGQLQTMLAHKDICALFKATNPRTRSGNDIQQAIVREIPAHPYLNPFAPKNIVTIKKDIGKNHVGVSIGFQWNDYKVTTNNETNMYKPTFVEQVSGRGWIIGRTFNKAILQLHSDKAYTIQGVFRAHQHSDPHMIHCILHNPNDYNCNHGVGRIWIEELPNHPQKLWHNIVCTFSVCPNTPYNAHGFNCDTYGILTVKENFDDWRLEVVQ